MQKKANTKEFTFPDSGETIHVPSISLAGIAMALRRRYPKPMPPMQEVDFGNGHTEKERNYSHPEYKLMVKDWEVFLEDQAANIAIERVFDFKLTKIQRTAIKEWKTGHPDWWDEKDKDKDIWVENIALSTDQDLIALMEFLRGDEPTEEGISAQADGF